MTTISALRFGAPPVRPARNGAGPGAVKTLWTRGRSVDPAVPDAASEGAPDSFLAALQDSPAEKLAEAWLTDHGISREALKAMTPEKREATLLQMTQELRGALQHGLAAVLGTGTLA